MKYFVLDAFTNHPFGGNPAGVVLLDGDTFPKESLMLQIAAELRYSETAFIRCHSDKEFTIRYFTPMDIIGKNYLGFLIVGTALLLSFTGWDRFVPGFALPRTARLKTARADKKD